MRYDKLGDTQITISRIVFGGWQSGKDLWVDVNDDETIAAHRAALDSGITSFDTAEAYGKGHSERVLASALKDRRDEITILTKVAPNNLAAEKVVEACERSLNNLQTDRIDVYQIHWPAGTFRTPVIPIEETMGAMVKLKEEGKIRAIGVSNFSGAQIEEAQQYGRIDSVQPPYSLFWRQVEQDVIPCALAYNMAVLAYSSLAQGLLTGKFGPDHKFAAEDNRSSNKMFRGETYRNAQLALDRLRPIAERNDLTLTQLALGWLTARTNVHAIVGARNAAQAVHNASAGDVSLSQSDLDEIDAIGRTVSDDFRNETCDMWIRS